LLDFGEHRFGDVDMADVSGHERQNGTICLAEVDQDFDGAFAVIRSGEVSRSRCWS
jgi:hypothetical protein